jgi:hypothetical protein
MTQSAFIVTANPQTRSLERTGSGCIVGAARLGRSYGSRGPIWRVGRTGVPSLRLCVSPARRGSFQIGDRVRVARSVIMYHTPMSKGQPYDVQGLEGVVTKFADEYQGLSISANRPIQVMLEGSKKFIAHFEANELEPIS